MARVYKDVSEIAVDFESYARVHGVGLLRVAYLLTKSKADAEDLTQDALLKLHTQWGRVSRADNPTAYGRRVLVNLFLSSKRGRRLESVPLADDYAKDRDANFPDLIVEREAVRHALRSLPHRQRAALVLRFYEQLSDAEIAACMNITQSSVRSAMARATRALQTHLSIEETTDDPLGQGTQPAPVEHRI